MSNTQDFNTNSNTDASAAAPTPNANEIPATPIEAAATPSICRWARVVDTLVAREIDAQFTAAGASRRDLRVLNMLSGERELSEHMRERLERRGGRLWSLADRGWITRADAEATRANGLTWQLTDAGVAARERLTAITESVRDRVEGSVSPEDLATTAASLEAIATEFGWTEGMRLPRGHRGGGRGHGRNRGQVHGHDRGQGNHDGHGHGHGHGHAHSHGHCHNRGEGAGRGNGRGAQFGPGHQFGPDHHFGPSHEGGHGFGRGRGRGYGGNPGEGHRPRAGRGEAFERGFVAGFAASRDSA